jgi:hypothetical protein
MVPTPTSTEPAAPSPTGFDVAEYVRTNRQNAGMFLLILSVVFLVLSAWTILRVTRSTVANEPDKLKKSDEKKSELDPVSEETATKVSDPHRTDYLLGSLAAITLFLVTSGGGLWLTVRPPAPSDTIQRREIRTLILVICAGAGNALIVIGIISFFRWSSLLTDYLEGKPLTDDIWFVRMPLMMIVIGAALAFAGLLPARAEERTDSSIRKWVYGTNLELSILLIFIVLVVANVALGRRLPNKLDTTQTGFYSLSQSTKDFLVRTDQPVTAYAILPEGGRASDDMRRLLTSCEDVPGSHLKVKFINPIVNKREYGELSRRFPILETNEGAQGGSFGVLLTVGPDEKRNSFIREDDFVKSEPGASRSQPTVTFVGESRLMRELQFLTENKEKAVVYFTQSVGELTIDRGESGNVPPSGSAVKLRDYLEKNFLEVRELKFDPHNAKVPDDASVVVVAEPRAPFAEPIVAAFRQYMTQPRGPENKKGKLILMDSGRFGPDGKVPATGLEPLLKEFNVRLYDAVLFGEPSQQLPSANAFAVTFSSQAVMARNPVAVALGEKAGFIASFWRPVEALDPKSQGPFRAVSFLETMPGRPSWIESEQPADLNRLISELNDSQAARVAKQLTDRRRSVAVVVSEGEVGRVAVFGNGLLFSDQISRQSRSGGDPITFDLLNATIDWLRDRPTVASGVEAKKYVEYSFPLAADETRGLWLPLALALLIVGGAGAGVWVIRRK